MKTITGKAILGLIGIAGVLSSCGVSSDGRLTLFLPDVKTNYRTADDVYVGCDNLTTNSGTSAAINQIRVDFLTSGAINTAQVRLVGEDTTDTSQDNLYIANFSRDNGTLQARGTNEYRAYLSVQPDSGQILPAQAPVKPQAVVVNPTPVRISIVSVSGRVYGNGGFRAELTGTSDTGAPAVAPRSALVPVYSNCTVQSETAETL